MLSLCCLLVNDKNQEYLFFKFKKTFAYGNTFLWRTGHYYRCSDNLSFVPGEIIINVRYRSHLTKHLNYDYPNFLLCIRKAKMLLNYLMEKKEH